MQRGSASCLERAACRVLPGGTRKSTTGTTAIKSRERPGRRSGFHSSMPSSWTRAEEVRHPSSLPVEGQRGSLLVRLSELLDQVKYR
ncbi:uncharacterized protein V6R79_020461 [Siganus canaliculatus]